MREEHTKKMKALNIVTLSYCRYNGPSICATFAQLSFFLADNSFIIREIPIIIGIHRPTWIPFTKKKLLFASARMHLHFIKIWKKRLHSVQGAWHSLSTLHYGSRWGFPHSNLIGHPSRGNLLKKSWRYQRGNQNPHIEEEQTTQWPKEKLQKDLMVNNTILKIE
jgi:hypothetical protein